MTSPQATSRAMARCGSSADGDPLAFLTTPWPGSVVRLPSSTTGPDPGPAAARPPRRRLFQRSPARSGLSRTNRSALRAHPIRAQGEWLVSSPVEK